MARVRVFLCTYRRPTLLPRALQSLRAQTFTDWTCELHNDAPDDPFPARLAAEIADPRIMAITHARNLGAIGTFNLLYAPQPEPYVTLLEDDNWWEPGFLERMVHELDVHPAVSVAWSNMRIWREAAGGGWSDTGECIWSRPPDAPVELLSWPQPRQAWHALHSNGAMLARTGHLEDLVLPSRMRFDFAEPARERAMPHPLLFVPQPLANFSHTLDTARPKSREGLMEHYVLMLASFFRHVKVADGVVAAIWAAAREEAVRSTDKLILAGLIAPECRRLLRHATAREVLLCLASQLAQPRLFWNTLHAASRYPELSDYLDRHTRARAAECTMGQPVPARPECATS